MRMKKFWIVLLSAVLSLACVMGFAACTERPGGETGGTVQPGDPSGPDDPDDPGKPHEHNFGEWVVTIPATCTEAGEEQRTCSCGETETRTVAASGHDYVNGVCTRCEDTITATDDSYFIFSELQDGTYSVAWDEDTDLPAEVVIPWEYNGKSVTQIGDWAFAYCDSLTSVTIPSGVTSIGSFALYDCGNFTSITIPDSVTSIGDYAFAFYDGLTSIIVSAENPVYHSDGNCLIETASKTLILGSNTSVIPDDGSVTSIGEMAFVYCGSLTNISIPDSVTSIGDAAFAFCGRLTSISIPDGVTSIGIGVFADCKSLASVTIPDSVTSIGDHAFRYCGSLTSITIPDSVTSIGDGAFRYCGSLTSITIPNSVTSIGYEVFAHCYRLASVTIGNGVTSIERSVFYYCISLTSITVSAENPVYHSDGNCLIETESKTLVAGCKNSVIPDDGSVTSIGDSAFRDCSSLTSVVFENPNGWRVDGEAIPAADLSDPATAAEYLTDTYCCDVWTRT